MIGFSHDKWSIHIKSLFIKIFGIVVRIDSLSIELLERIRSDFSQFCPSYNELIGFDINIHAIQDNNPPKQKVECHSNRKLYSNKFHKVFATDHLRYVQYLDGAAHVFFDYQKNSCEIYGQKIDHLHELTYLIILSRSSKKMEFQGLHKIHACAVHKDGLTYIFVMPSKTGKSTFFLEFMKEDQFEIISDDSPVINKNADVYPFPLRVGMNDLLEIPGHLKVAYKLDRMKYGLKYLIDLDQFKAKVHNYKNEDKFILVFGTRKSIKLPKIKKIGGLKAFTYLVFPMIIGVGLPLIKEIYLEFTLKDFFDLFQILRSRVKASIKLIQRSQCYEMTLGKDLKKNIEFMRNNFMKHNDFIRPEVNSQKINQADVF